MIRIIKYTFVAVTMLSLGIKPLHAEDIHLKTVQKVDLKRYQGTWYEIAKLPNRFQKDCVTNTSATYTLLPTGEVQVLNTCQKSEGTISKAEGIAWRPNPKDQGKLKVSFIPVLKHLHLFGGDYWILKLEPDYSVVLVGSPDRKYLWILARSTQMDEDLYDKYLQIAQDRGYDSKKVIKTQHFD